MKYFFITFSISLFVIFYVWQNIEMMKMKMVYHRLIGKEVILNEERAKLLYEFEKSRNFENMKRAAESADCKIIEPEDVYFFKGSDVKKGRAKSK